MTDPRITAENACWLLAQGEHPERIAIQLGRTVVALEKLLRRTGNPLQARQFATVMVQNRRRT